MTKEEKLEKLEALRNSKELRDFIENCGGDWIEIGILDPEYEEHCRERIYYMSKEDNAYVFYSTDAWGDYEDCDYDTESLDEAVKEFVAGMEFDDDMVNYYYKRFILKES